jgi:CRP-like cAMP-binding protein
LENGCRQVIAFGLPGDIVGFPDGGLHQTECDALTPVAVIAHRRTAFEAGEGDPKTHQRLFHAALREISAMQDHLMMLARKSALEKVASFLIALSQRTGTHSGADTTIDLPMSRADIADFLGLTIETVSRTFSQLRKLGAIVLRTPQTVLVRDFGALIKVSQTAV